MENVTFSDDTRELTHFVAMQMTHECMRMLTFHDDRCSNYSHILNSNVNLHWSIT